MTLAKPFVKWAGGKTNLLPQLKENYPVELINNNINKYVEPFVGGGAVMLDIIQNHNVKEFYAFDINKDLIDTYKTIQNNVEELINKLSTLQEEYIPLNFQDRTTYYNKIRSTYNENKDAISIIEKSAYFIFLNKTCFNGLYRVNQKGAYNVPMGKYEKPLICDENNLRTLSNKFKNVTFFHGNYSESLEYIDDKTFVYFDPPYRPLTKAGFTSYTKENFNDDNQKELANYFKDLSNIGAKLMLSNSNPQNTNPDDLFFKNIYKDFTIKEIFAARMINSNGAKRGKISELLIKNY